MGGTRDGVRTPSPHDGGAEVLVLVVAYEAESTIVELLERIPSRAGAAAVEVLVAEDAGADRTAELAESWAREHPAPPTAVVRRDTNLGYGGNQAAGFAEAVASGATVVVVLHGDGQYPPEVLDDLVTPILEDRADAVFGTRMSSLRAARRGGMPLDRVVGNRVLSRLQNLLTGVRLSEWHSGLRAYRVAVLRRVDLDTLTTGFDFDTAITLRLIELGARMSEIPIPTRYGDEESRVRPYRTGMAIMARTTGWALRNRRSLRPLRRP